VIARSRSGLNRVGGPADAASVRTTGGSTRSAGALVCALTVVVLCAGVVPSAFAAGEGTSVPGVTEDPFTGSPAPASPGIARSSGFRFFWSGFGHGIGMSQWGAYGLAQMGWSHKRILKQFYRGTRVGRIADPVTRLRVGLTWDERVIHVSAKGGPVKFWVGRAGGRKVGRIPDGRTWAVRAKASGFAVRNHDGSLVGGRT
jgi:hypothetical protein